MKIALENVIFLRNLVSDRMQQTTLSLQLSEVSPKVMLFEEKLFLQPHFKSDLC